MRSKKIIFLLLCIILTGCAEKTYTVTFDTNGGNVMDSITLVEGSNIEDIAKPTKEGYLFVNWSKDGIEYNEESPITEDITLTANWIETPDILNYYTVTFINADVEEKFVVNENDTVKEPKAKEKANYKFIGWYLDDVKYDFNTKVTKDITLVAKYELDIIKVTYELDGGTGLSFEIIPKNSLLPIPEKPVKEGYRFLKWTLNGEEFSFTKKLSEDVTLKAIWEKIEYVTVSYDTDGGSLIKQETIEKYSQLTDLPVTYKEGYIFKEWQLDNQTFNTDTIIKTDIVLKAIWEKEN